MIKLHKPPPHRAGWAPAVCGKARSALPRASRWGRSCGKKTMANDDTLLRESAASAQVLAAGTGWGDLGGGALTRMGEAGTRRAPGCCHVPARSQVLCDVHHRCLGVRCSVHGTFHVEGEKAVRHFCQHLHFHLKHWRWWDREAQPLHVDACFNSCKGTPRSGLCSSFRYK